MPARTRYSCYLVLVCFFSAQLPCHVNRDLLQTYGQDRHCYAVMPLATSLCLPPPTCDISCRLVPATLCKQEIDADKSGNGQTLRGSDARLHGLYLSIWNTIPKRRTGFFIGFIRSPFGFYQCRAVALCQGFFASLVCSFYLEHNQVYHSISKKSSQHHFKKGSIATYSFSINKVRYQVSPDKISGSCPISQDLHPALWYGIEYWIDLHSSQNKRSVHNRHLGICIKIEDCGTCAERPGKRGRLLLP